MKVLHVIHSIDPSFGGTVEALLQIVKASEKTEQNHEILTLDDPDQLKGFNYPQKIHAVGPTKRFYGDTPKLDNWLNQHLKSYDCAVIHGCWQYHGLATYRACRKFGIPYLQYTHGMLDPWFKRTYPLKHLKKWLYWPWAEYRILKHASRVIFTCEEEKRLAAKSFWLYQVNPAVIPLGIKEPEVDIRALCEAFYAQFEDLKGKRMLTFMSRIHPKKGVDLLVEAALKLQTEQQGAHHNPEEKVTLVIAGPCKDEAYLENLKKRSNLLAKDGPLASIRWLPMVQGSAKWCLLKESEAFILPSHQENFGMVVAESLYCETPVLISDKVNIWKEVADANAAIIAPDTQEGALKLMQHWLELSAEERQHYRARAKACFEAKFRIAYNAVKLFDLIEKTAIPTSK